MPETAIPSPLTGRQLVDESFIQQRAHLLEIAAFLDRVDRADAEAARADHRMRAFHEALQLLGAGAASRVEAIQMLFSDPDLQPRPRSDGRTASGAHAPEPEEVG